MSIAQKPVVLCGVAAAVLLSAQLVPAQEHSSASSAAPAARVITTPDGKTIMVSPGPGGRPRIVSPPGASPAGPVSRPEKPDEKEAEKSEDKDKEKPDSEKGKGPDSEKGKPDVKEEEKKKPEPVKRESTPPEPPDPKQLEVRPDESGVLHEFNFTHQPWPGVVQWLADISQMSLDWQELPGDYLNLTTNRRYTVREIRDLINQHLLARGYTLLEQGEFLSVAKVEDLDPALVPRVEPEELEKRDPHEYVKVLFELDWLPAETAVEEFKPMLSPNAKLNPLKTTNRIEAMDAVQNLRDVYALIQEEQSGEGKKLLVQTFRLKHSLAEEVLVQLQELLGIESKSKGPAIPMSPDQMRAQQEAMRKAAEQAQKGGAPPTKPKPEVYLVADKRRNLIVANAPPDTMAKIEQAIEALDAPRDQTGSLERTMLRTDVYRLQSIEADTMVETLKELGDLDFDTRLDVDEDNNAILAYASLGDHIFIRSLIDKLDSGGRRSHVIPLVELRAESVVKIIDFVMGGGREEEQESRSSRSYFPPWYSSYRGSSRRREEEHEDQFRVEADAKNNALILWCNEFELAKVEQLLDDLRQNQQEPDEPNVPRPYRLETLNAETFVKILEDMEALSFSARLEVDEENNSIVAYASEADHRRIKDLIEELDGSARTLEVIPLSRLEADYVAGTIALLMTGKGDEQKSSGYSRTYVYNEYYGGSPGRSSGQQKKPDEFRVDADIEYNRLLLWCNEVELEEVKKLLVKLGEIPPEGGDPSTIRVLDLLPGPDTERLLEKIRRAWPSLAPNPLLLPPPEETEEEEGDKKKPGQGPTSGQPQRTAGTDVPAVPTSGESTISGKVREGFRTQPQRPVFHLAQLEQTGAEANPGSADVRASATVDGDAPASETAEDNAEPPNQSEAAPAKTSPNPDQPASEDSSQEAPERVPPVTISRGPGGRLVISSEDTEALDRLEQFINQLAPRRPDYRVFHLQYAEAYWVKVNLEEFFKEGEKKDSRDDYMDWYFWPYSSGGSSSDTTRRLSRRRPLKFIDDPDTNTILVQGATPDQLQTIDELIELYDRPPSTEAESARRTEVFYIRYSKAAIIEKAIKEVYADLLSTRDKSLAGRQEQQQKTESRYSYTYVFGDGDEGERKMPRWKGYLSIGVDEVANTLVVSAPEFLFRDVEKIIQQLDEAAKPADTVHVLQAVRGVSAARLQEALGKVMAETSGRKEPAAERPREGNARASRERRANNTRRD